MNFRNRVSLAVAAMSFSILARSVEELGYQLLCETRTKRFTLEIADKDIESGLATLTIYDRVGESGTILKGTTSVNIDATWGENRTGRYISGFNYKVGAVIKVELRRTRSGLCENQLGGGTRYRARINSNQPMLEFKNTPIECESARVYVGGRIGGGGTSM